MMQLVVWLVIATVNPGSDWGKVDPGGGYHGQRFVAAYTTEAECQKHARRVNADQERALAKLPNMKSEIFECAQVVVETRCHIMTDGSC